MTSPSPATARSCSSPTGPAARSASSTRRPPHRRHGSPSASTPTRSPSIPSDDRIFVACASSNCVSVIDTRRGIVTETIHTALFPQGTRGEHARRPGRRSRRQDALRGQRRQQLRRGHRHRRAEPEPGQGLHPHRLVSDRRGGHARRQAALLVGVGKGNQTKANPIDAAKAKAKPKPTRVARRRTPAVPLHRHDALGIAVDRPGPRRQGARRVHRDGLQELPVFRQAAHRRPLPREDGHPHQGRRPVADQACALHHQGEPDLRPGLRRHAARQRRPVAGDVRPRGDAQPPQAGRGVRAARQPLLQRPRLGRRPPVVDDGVQHRLHRPQLGLDLLEPGRDPRRRRRRPLERPLGLSLGCLRAGRA